MKERSIYQSDNVSFDICGIWHRLHVCIEIPDYDIHKDIQYGGIVNYRKIVKSLFIKAVKQSNILTDFFQGFDKIYLDSVMVMVENGLGIDDGWNGKITSQYFCGDAISEKIIEVKHNKKLYKAYICFKRDYQGEDDLDENDD